MSKYEPRLKAKYRDEVAPGLLKKFGYKSSMSIPRLEKISLNMGVGEAIGNPKTLEAAARDMAIIAGQQPVITAAKKSISNFKLRQGFKIGCKVTLRRERMWEFLDRFISVAVPRMRDFRGLPDRSFDGWGNYSLSIREQIIFPEISYDNIDKIRGMNINFTTTARNDEEAYALLSLLGMPFRKRES